MIGLKRGTVKLNPHNSQWSMLYEKEKSSLISSLNEYVVEIQHIGSTSIPNIAAKPILDIVVGIKSVDDIRKVESIAKVLVILGYDWRRQNSLPDHHIFAKGPEDKRIVYLHLVEHNGEIWKNDISFRDYLTKNSEISSEYEDLKKKLAEKYSDNREQYTKGKRTFINKVLKLAKNL